MPVSLVCLFPLFCGYCAVGLFRSVVLNVGSDGAWFQILVTVMVDKVLITRRRVPCRWCVGEASVLVVTEI